MELLHLQTQVNPHFFFNTLNNLYGLIDQDTTKAKSMVLTLSDMMRYSIYVGQKELVTLEQELAYIENYVALHKSRYHKETDIKLNHHLQKEGFQVMPLLFIILLENAFKHGVENLRENAYVQINLIGGENEVSFSVENNFDPDELAKKAGIGLKNLKRRLELVYPKRHALSFSVSNDIYKAQLTLKS
ncbi:MAG: histidine kinase [Cyclobacteriaceae bacterium]